MDKPNNTCKKHLNFSFDYYLPKTKDVTIKEYFQILEQDIYLSLEEFLALDKTNHPFSYGVMNCVDELKKQYWIAYFYSHLPSFTVNQHCELKDNCFVCLKIKANIENNIVDIINNDQLNIFWIYDSYFKKVKVKPIKVNNYLHLESITGYPLPIEVYSAFINNRKQYLAKELLANEKFFLLAVKGLNKLKKTNSNLVINITGEGKEKLPRSLFCTFKEVEEYKNRNLGSAEDKYWKSFWQLEHYADSVSFMCSLNYFKEECQKLNSLLITSLERGGKYR